MKGILFGLGIGPGDPELITLKALRVLSNCPVIAYPAPEVGASMVRAIASSFIPNGSTEIVVRTPMIAGNFPANDIYDYYSDQMRNHLAEGKDVAFLCEGDPFLYGSFSYIFMRLSDEFVTKVIPGVSSLSACSAAIGVPLVLRNETLFVIPATLKRHDLVLKISEAESIAIMKVGKHLKKIRNLFRELGISRSAYYVEHASMESQKIMPLEDTDGLKAPYFSMVLVHKGE